MKEDIEHLKNLGWEVEDHKDYVYGHRTMPDLSIYVYDTGKVRFTAPAQFGNQVVDVVLDTRGLELSYFLKIMTELMLRDK